MRRRKKGEMSKSEGGNEDSLASLVNPAEFKRMICNRIKPPPFRSGASEKITCDAIKESTPKIGVRKLERETDVATIRLTRS